MPEDTSGTGEVRTAVRRRGRPYRLPEDPFPVTHAQVGVDQRTAWLLGLSRVHAAHGAGSTREDFIALLRDRGLRVDQSRISRWESGRQGIPMPVVAAYESLLGLPSGQLTAVVAGMRHGLGEPVRRWGGDEVPPMRDGFATGESHPSCGEDWLRLARDARSSPVLGGPSVDWAERAHRLVHELCRSVGLAYLRRFEAARLLMGHPLAQRHVVRALGRLALDPVVQYVLDPLCLIKEVRDPQAGELTIRLLEQGRPAHRRGAAWAAAARAVRGYPDDPSRLEGLTLRMLTESGGRQVDPAALGLYAALPQPARIRLLRGVEDGEVRARMETAHRHRELVPPEDAATVSVRLAGTVQSGTDATPEPDPMLRRLLREALFHVDAERQFHAVALLGASPYRHATARALVAVLGRAGEQVAVRALTVLAAIVTDDQRDEVLRWAVGEQRPAIRSLALRTLGHLPGRGLGGEDQQVARLLRRPEAGALERATLYALGMTASPRLAEAQALGGDVARLASWWRDVGGAIHEA